MFHCFWFCYCSGGAKASTASSFNDATPTRVSVDTSVPTTTLQLVLADRKRLKETFNHNTSNNNYTYTQHLIFSIVRHLPSFSCLCCSNVCTYCGIVYIAVFQLYCHIMSLTGLSGFELLSGMYTTIGFCLFVIPSCS